jgi:hypothetical protein
MPKDLVGAVDGIPLSADRQPKIFTTPPKNRRTRTEAPQRGVFLSKLERAKGRAPYSIPSPSSKWFLQIGW